MREIEAMTNDEIIAKTREFEADIRKNKTLLTRL
jgi:preprotein translocase subunit SecA